MLFFVDWKIAGLARISQEIYLIQFHQCLTPDENSRR